MRSPHHPRPVEPSESPFAVLERTFRLLVSEPAPLAVHGAEIGHGLPDRLIPLDELRSRLLHPSTRYATRDAALNVLLRRAREEGGTWLVALAGVLLPGLRRGSSALKAACPGKAADVEAEMLAGLVEAVAKIRLDQPKPAARLTWTARRAAEHLIRSELAERARPGHHPVSAEPPRPFGHPDLVLARAVADGVICADDAELIGATRLGEHDLADAALAWGLSYKAVERRRSRAELALVAWIREDFVADRPQTPGSKGVGRPRQGRRPDRRPGRANPPQSPTSTP